MSAAFLDEGSFQGGGSEVLQNFEAWLLIKGGSDRFRMVFKGAIQKGVRLIFQGGVDTLAETMKRYPQILAAGNAS